MQLKNLLSVMPRVVVVILMAMLAATKADAASISDRAPQLTNTVVADTIKGIVAELRDGYVFVREGTNAADALEKSFMDKAYSGVGDPAVFARQLTDQLRTLTGDGHMRVIFGSPFADQPAAGAPQGTGIEVQRLAGNIGLIRITRFAPPEVFKPAADDAMRSVADTDALIIDVRTNGGGHPASVAYEVSYFLGTDKAVPINSLVWRNRGTETFRTETFTSSPTPLHYVGKPIYVLIGPATYSAGEEFAYDLQVMKRATLVGARTRGGANPGGLTDLGTGFFAVVPTGRAENPITHTNWEGVGVGPDVEASSDLAEATAYALAKG